MLTAAADPNSLVSGLMMQKLMPMAETTIARPIELRSDVLVTQVELTRRELRPARHHPAGAPQTSLAFTA